MLLPFLYFYGFVVFQRASDRICGAASLGEEDGAAHNSEEQELAVQAVDTLYRAEAKGELASELAIRCVDVKFLPLVMGATPSLCPECQNV